MRKLLAVLSILCVVLLSSGAGAQTPAPAPSDDVQALIDRRVAEFPGTGMVLGIIDHGKTSTYTSGVTGTSAPLNEHTVFEIGSVTKTFTATLLASMVAEKRVRLDDPVQKYLPQGVRVPGKDGKQITLLTLAEQDSGLPRMPSNINVGDGADPYATYDSAQLYDFLSHYTLTRDPGTQYEYSNYGVGLLGTALANQAKTTYAQLVTKRIFAPLGMRESSVAIAPAPAAGLAQGHDGDGDPVHAWTFKSLAPAGGIRSTLSDMIAYLRANMGSGPLAAPSAFAQRPRKMLPPEMGGSIGLIWMTGSHSGTTWHNGETGGFHSFIGVSKDRTRGVVILWNDAFSVDDIGLHLLVPSYPVADFPNLPLDAATVQSYLGTYKNAQQTFVVVSANGKLLVKLNDQPAFPIYGRAKDSFYYRIVPAQIEFTRDSAGRVRSLTLLQDGASYRADKQ